MSLRSVASADAQDLLALDGETITITIPAVAPASPAVYAVTGTYTRRGAHADADGLMVVGDESVVTVSLADLEEKGLASPETLRDTKGVLVSAGGVSYRADQVLLDRTLDVATMFLKRVS